MCAFTVDFDRQEMGYSPDRVDALVWALTELMIEGFGHVERFGWRFPRLISGSEGDEYILLPASLRRRFPINIPVK
jgi:hypothetical protein